MRLSDRPDAEITKKAYEIMSMNDISTDWLSRRIIEYEIKANDLKTMNAPDTVIEPVRVLHDVFACAAEMRITNDRIGKAEKGK